jgi:hypothetical protein
MPEGNDPQGYLAHRQRISKELLCAASSLQSRKAQATSPPEATEPYIVTNPVTNQSTVIRVPKAHPTGHVAPSSVATFGSEGSRASSARLSEANLKAQASRSGPPKGVAVSTAASSTRRSTVPPSTHRSTAQREALHDRLKSLEATLDEERAGRQHVQQELARLSELLQRQLAPEAGGRL